MVMIESTWLRAFAAFAEDANISRAARRLHLSQPAVHAQLRKLSAELGVSLYRRAGRGLVLTPEGIEVAAFARGLEEQSRELIARMSGSAAEDRIVLAAGPGALLYVIGEGLRAFTKQRKTRLDLLTADASSAIEAVRSGLAHVGVGALDAAPGDLEVHALSSVEQMLVVRREHPLARQRHVSIPKLAGERFVLPPEGRPHRAMLDAAFRAHGTEVALGATATGWELTLKLVELGFGIAIVNACCRVTRGLVTRPIRDLPAVRYTAFTRRRPREQVAELVRLLLSKGDAWRERAHSVTFR
jgi:DNA-binding transcriptional LysR family regulator